MALTAMGIGTKQAPENVNLDPQRQFWSWLASFIHPDEKTADNYHHQRGYFHGFACRQNDPAGMSIQIGGAGSVDSALLAIGSGRCVLLSTDGEPEVVTIPTAPATGSRIDAVVSYVDTTGADAGAETPGTPEYVKTVVVSGTAASSPSAPTDAEIVAALPAGAGGTYYRWCDVRVAQGTTVITNSNITDRKPASPNVYLTTSDIQDIARPIAQDEAEDVMTQNDNYSGITWYGVNMYIWRRGNVAGLWVDGPVQIQIPASGTESGKIPSWARPSRNVRASLTCDAAPQYGGTVIVLPNGNFTWAGSGPINTTIYPSLNMSWPIN